IRYIPCWRKSHLSDRLLSAIAQRCVNDQVLTQRSVKLTCSNGFFEPTACLVQEQGGTIEVAINSTKNVDGFWIKCQMDGNTIRYVKEPRCIVDGKQYHINDSLKTANVVYKCLGTTIEPLGCYFVNANGQEINISLGQTLLLDNVQHRCRPGNLNSSSL
uniref:Abnormal cell migration protein 18-like fibronectin type I domain-containing protein n=1 Tax=Romanomermis culicivorax TaxID=13658 RepID=A0A915JIN8_ROMCU